MEIEVDTRDRVIRLEANVELLEDLEHLNEFGAEGVGLYRSEFMLSGRPLESVTEDEQYEMYRGLIAQVAPRPVTIRTFDLDERQVGRDQKRPERRRSRPGLRGLRLGLANPAVLRTQLRALVRASLLACLLAIAMPVFALGLGRIVVKSAPGQPLLAEIPVVAADPSELGDLQVRLASPETFRRVGLPAPDAATANLRFTVAVDGSGQPVIRVTSAAPIRRVIDGTLSYDAHKTKARRPHE